MEFALSADTLSQLVVLDYVKASGIAIMTYDYLLTFDLEVDRFWRRPKFSVVAMLFYLNRYGVILSHILPLIILARPDLLLIGNNCFLYHRVYTDFRIIFNHLIITAILLFRTSVIHGHSRMVMGILTVAVVGMIVNGAIAWSSMEKSNGISTLPGLPSACINLPQQSQGAHIAIMWTGVLVLDLVVFVLTIKRTLALSRYSPKGRTTMWSVMTRDGAMYFGAISLANLANILMLLIAPNGLKVLLSDFINVLASILMSRFTLNLRDQSLLNPRAQDETALRISIKLATISDAK